MRKSLYSLLLLLILFSCGISRPKQRESSSVKNETINQNKRTLLLSLSEQTKSWHAIKAKLKARLSIKDKAYSARIQLQATNGKGIRLSVHYLLFEVARIWFTPEEVVFVDLINGAYARERYIDFGARLGLTLDYAQIESLIMGGVFAPGVGADMRSLETLRYDLGDEGKQRLSGLILDLKYTFGLSAQGGVENLQVLNKKGNLLFDAHYRRQVPSGLSALAPTSLHEYNLYKSVPTGQADQLPKGTLILEWQSLEHLSQDNEQVLIPKIKEKYFRVDLAEVFRIATSAGASN